MTTRAAHDPHLSSHPAVSRRPRRSSGVSGIELTRERTGAHGEILTTEALRFLVELHRTFEHRRQALLRRRETVRRQIEEGLFPDFNPDTAEIRRSAWTVAPIPRDLQDRRVEITGPVERKMIINALNSGANVFMADFEDSNSPTWENVIDGQVNLRDAVRRTITYTSPDGKHYALNDDPAVLFVRPRGWHLVDQHCLVDRSPIAGALLDFGLFFFHNAQTLIDAGTGPYFYLPKLEDAAEAELWNDVFIFAQDYLGIPRGTIRATVLIENILAAFQMDEILWELKEHSAGLNCGRWDYIFSFIKTFADRPGFTLPDRGQVTMDRPFLDAYVRLLIKTCHRRGVHAMGGMAAQIPLKHDPDANARALEKVRQDKLREVQAGHDGTWVAHPGLVPVAREIFDAHMPGPNQIDRHRDDTVTAAELLAVPDGTITRDGLRHNIDVGILYLEAWLRGAGCVPIYGLMEDAATAEISRTQVWQWIRHGARLEDGARVTPSLVEQTILEVLETHHQHNGHERFANGKYTLAGRLFKDMVVAPRLPEWLTTIAYQHLD